MKLSEHFDSGEFMCKCSKHCLAKPDKELINKLEKLFERLDAKSVIITSGYRCPEHSVNVGGTVNDAHTRNIAADIVAYKKDGCYFTSAEIAEAAEIVGFTGIGIISPTAVHVDVRNKNNYVNDHWFGDETTGDNFIKTFIREPKAQKRQISITVDIDDHKYSGLIEEE